MRGRRRGKWRRLRNKRRLPPAIEFVGAMPPPRRGRGPRTRTMWTMRRATRSVSRRRMMRRRRDQRMQPVEGLDRFFNLCLEPASSLSLPLPPHLSPVWRSRNLQVPMKAIQNENSLFRSVSEPS